MEHAVNPPPPPDSWQQTAAALYKITALAARQLCRRCAVPPGEAEEVVAEALLSLCLNVKGAWGRGTRGFDCTFFALSGLTACRTRRGRPLPQLRMAPAARNPG